jgi:zinc and cadmium transporter
MTLALIATIILIMVASSTLVLYKLPIIRNNVRSFLALSAGALLASAIIHILPEGIELMGGWTFEFGLTIIATIVFHFLLESFLRWRECCNAGQKKTYRLGILNLVGDFWCNIIDGMAIVSSFLVSPIAGWTTTLAILLHEIPQEVGDYAVLLHSGFKTKQAFIGNLIVAMGHMVGFLFSWLLISNFGFLHPYFMAIAVGSALYLALSTLIPEVHRTHEDKFNWISLILFIVGLVLVTLTKFIESH